MFHIEAEKEVVEANRSCEFISLKHALEELLAAKFPMNETYGFHDLGDWSCEQVAEYLHQHLSLKRCVVFEDGENGGGFES